MRRKYRDVQRLMDDAVLVSISEGRGTHAELRAAVRNVARDNLTGETGNAEVTIGYLLDVLASVNTSSSKQRLRDQGLIEITQGNTAKLSDQLSQEDVEFIDSRRASTIHGMLESRVAFNHRHGRIEQAEEAQRQLTLFVDTCDSEEITTEAFK